MDNQTGNYPTACAHIYVERFQIEKDGRAFEEQWRCKDCGAKFVNLDSFFAGPQRIEVMEPMATLRDQFAMAALTGMLADENVSVGGTYDAKNAQLCYGIADAMLKARK